MSVIDNCEKGNQQNVGPEDISEKLSGSRRDNDWYCPIAGLNVILVKEGTEYFCVLPRGVNCSKWEEDPHNQTRFDQYT